MKRIITLFILLSQITWTFGSSLSIKSKKCDDILGCSVAVAVPCFSDLVRVVQSSVEDNLKRMVEISCLIPRLPGKNDTKRNKKEPTDDGQQNPLCVGQSTVEGGRLKVEGGRLKVEGGRLKVEGGRWKVEGGRWKVEGGRWKVEGGRREDASDIIRFTILSTLKFCVYAPRGGVTDVVSRLAGLQIALIG